MVLTLKSALQYNLIFCKAKMTVPFIVEIVGSRQWAVGSVFRPIFMDGGRRRPVVMEMYRENRGYGQ